MLSRAVLRSPCGAQVASGARALSSGTEWFPSVQSIKFAGPESKDPLSFKHYNASQVVMGKVSTRPIRKSGSQLRVAAAAARQIAGSTLVRSASPSGLQLQLLGLAPL